MARSILAVGRAGLDPSTTDIDQALGVTSGAVGPSHRYVPRGRTVLPGRVGDVVGLTWVLLAGLAIFVPMVLNGQVFGPFDLVSAVGLTSQPGVTPHILQNSDLANSLIPWWGLAWQQVHQGHLPLWNPYGGLGTPLAFNWQSAPFSLPALVGYLAPARYAFTVGVAVNMVVAGSGAYFFARVLRMSVIAAATVGTVFELSGPFVAWLGYPFPSVMSWSGWIFAFVVLLLRGRHRVSAIVGLAVSVAFALYGGAPEGFTVLGLAAAVFVVVVLLCRTSWLGGSGPVLKPAVDVVLGTAAGLALAAPFALPGLQLVAGSVRSSPTTGVHLRPQALLYLAFQTFDGLPIIGRGGVHAFGLAGLFYTETAAYVGVATLVLALVAVVRLRRRPEVRALAAVAVACLTIIFVTPLNAAAGHLPLVGGVEWVRALMPLAMVLAVLAGFGVDLIVRASPNRRPTRALGIGFGSAALALLVLWTFGRGHLPPDAASVRAHSFIWPAVETAVGLAAVGFLFWVDRGRRTQRGLARWAGVIAAVGLLVAQSVFLVSAASEMLQTSRQRFPQTATTREFQAAVGTGTVAFGTGPGGASLGIDPNVNDAYGVHELEAYDPTLPKDYFSAWTADTGTPAGFPVLNLFVPAVRNVEVAREFGIEFVLEPSGRPGPTGTTFVRHLGNEDLYRVPGSGEATVAPLSNGAFPPDRTSGTPVVVEHPGPGQWSLHTSSTGPQALRLHLSDVPGWHATIDGRPLRLYKYAGFMLEARVPPGDHLIALHYWPGTLTLGLVLAGLSTCLLVAMVLVSRLRRRRPGWPSTDGRGPAR